MVQIFRDNAMITIKTFNRLLSTLSLLILLAPSQLLSQRLSSFKEEIFLEKNGEANVVWDFKLEKNSIEQIKFPWNFSTDGAAKIVFKINPGFSSDKDALDPKIVVNDGVYFIQIGFTKIPHNTEYHVEFRLPLLFNFNKEKVADFGNYTLKYRFINSMLAGIDNFSSEVVLPEGFVVTSVDETIPKQTEDNPVSPFQVTSHDKKSSVVIKAPKLKIGEQAFIKIQIKSDRKSMFLLIALMLAGVLYLYFFRDLVAKKKCTDQKRN
jgi:hypothetical protein